MKLQEKRREKNLSCTEHELLTSSSPNAEQLFSHNIRQQNFS